MAHLVRNPYITSLDGPTAGTSGEKCPAYLTRWPNHWDIRIEILSAFEDMRLDLILHSREKAGKRDGGEARVRAYQPSRRASRRCGRDRRGGLRH